MPSFNTSLTNPVDIAIADNATRSSFQSFGNFSTFTWGRIRSISVVLDLNYGAGDDLDFLLIGPDGRNLEFWSDAGGPAAFTATWTIGDTNANLAPDSTTASSGSYRPADYGEMETSSNWSGVPAGLTINHPTPNGSATLTSAFAGTWLDNSSWQLLVRDDTVGNFSGDINSWTLQITYDVVVKPHDFGNSSVVPFSDILWQRSDGTAGIWLMNGFNAESVSGAGPNGWFPYTPGPDWRIKGDGDFNDDGKSDVLWQNLDGTPGIWLMDGFKAVSMGPVGTNPGAGWHIKDTGDFNFDSKSDILWQSSDGSTGIWLMDGLTLAREPGRQQSGPELADQGQRRLQRRRQGRHPVAARNGTAGIWLMDGLNVHRAGRGRHPTRAEPGRSKAPATSTATARPTSCGSTRRHRRDLADERHERARPGPVGTNPDASWQIEGSGDYNGDARSDILWQNSDGQAGIWFMNGLTVLNAGVAGSFNPGPIGRSSGDPLTCAGRAQHLPRLRGRSARSAGKGLQRESLRVCPLPNPPPQAGEGVHRPRSSTPPNKNAHARDHVTLAAHPALAKNGGPGGTRTPDLRFRKPLLYPAELRDRSTALMRRRSAGP